MASLSEIAKMDLKDLSLKALLPSGSGGGSNGASNGGPNGRSNGAAGKSRLGGSRRGAPKKGAGGGVLVGVDVQPGYVAAVEVEGGGSLRIKRAHGVALPADVVREGEVLDEGLLAEALKELFAAHRLGKRVRLGLANQRTVVRMMELPPLTDRREIAAAVSFQAQDQIPMPLQSAVLDFHALGVVDTPAGPRQRVVVVAAQRDMVEKLVRAVRAAGLKPIAVDLSAFALIRAMHAVGAAGGGAMGAGGVAAVGDDDGVNRAGEAAALAGGDVGPVEDGDIGLIEGEGVGLIEGERVGLIEGEGVGLGVGESPGEARGEATRGRETTARADGDETPAVPQSLYLNVGGLTNMAIAEGVTCRFTRMVGGGLESMASALAERRSIPLTQARARIAAVNLTDASASAATGLEGLPAPEDRAAGDGEGPAEVSAGGQASAEETGEAREIIALGVREIAREVRNSLDFYRVQDGGGEVASVVASGAALEISGFAAALEADLGMPIERRVVTASGRTEVPAERLAIAAGLALEEVRA